MLKSIYDLPKNPNIKITASAFSAPLYIFSARVIEFISFITSLDD